MAVVQVRDKLVGKEIPECRTRTKQRECARHGSRFGNSSRKLLTKHLFQQMKVHLVLALESVPPARSHDVSRRIQPLAARECLAEDAIVRRNVKTLRAG